MMRMKEKLSELVDGELHDGMAPQLDQLATDQNLRQTWERYHLIGAVLREEHSSLPEDFASRFETRLKEEPVVLCRPREHKMVDNVVALPVAASRQGSWQNFALAASLAAIALLSWHQFGTPLSSSSLANQTANGLVAQNQGRIDTAFQAGRKNKDLDIYLFEHGQYASASDFSGLMAYTTFVSNGASD